MSAQKQVHQLAKQLFKLSFADGHLSSERVAGVLGYVEKTKPHHTLAVLQSYHRMVKAEVARNHATIEHAGVLAPQTLQSMSAALSKKYGRTISTSAQPNPELLAGLRVRVGDDVYESSIVAQLSALANSL